MNEMIIEEKGLDIIVTFPNCKCRFTFWKMMMERGFMNVKVSYCNKYPNCGLNSSEVFENTRKHLLAEASEPILVIPDEDAEDMIGMDWTGMI